MTPLSQYERRLARGEIAPDPAQREAARALERLHGELVAAGGRRRRVERALARLAGRPVAPVRGLYLWGDVGRGKTFLLDLFFASLPFEDKMRRHFHRFMAGVHEELKRLRDRAEPLDAVAAKIAAETRVICFDELVVSDIADAMILGRLFEGLFARGVTLAATSNIAPDDLYRDGLQRQRFLPAIELIKRHVEVLHVAGAVDYRLRVLERADVYRHPSGPEADRRLERFFAELAPDAGEGGGEIAVHGRPIPYRRAADGVIWFDFAAVCEGPRSQDDYIELSRLYQTVLVSDVPQFTPALEDQARRFIALVDEFYDRRVKLVLSAAAPVAELYRGKRLIADFARTRSRLEEMQSHDYLAAAHRP
ncbi:MAG TPA: cell division protein ZapE [Gammaproteobacteria bacterium]